jgi:hypothetical protein
LPQARCRYASARLLITLRQRECASRESAPAKRSRRGALPRALFDAAIAAIIFAAPLAPLLFIFSIFTLTPPMPPPLDCRFSLSPLMTLFHSYADYFTLFAVFHRHHDAYAFAAASPLPSFLRFQMLIADAFRR